MKTPSSSSSSSFGLNSGGSAAGCLPGVLRRLLCGALDAGDGEGFLPTSPAAAPPVPGLVARLMGLETLPVVANGPRGPAADRWPVFREAGEFLLLSFCADDGEESLQSESKTDMKEASVRTRAGKKRTEKKKKKQWSTACRTMAEADSGSSQNLSPVSVLVRSPEQDGEEQTDTSATISDAEEEAAPGRSSRRKLSSELDCIDGPPPPFPLTLDEKRETATAVAGPLCSADPWAEARRLAEEEVDKSKWVHRDSRKTEDSHEIAVELGLHILDSLICDAVGSLKTCNYRSSSSPPPHSLHRASETLIVETTATRGITGGAPVGRRLSTDCKTLQVGDLELSVFTMKVWN